MANHLRRQETTGNYRRELLCVVFESRATTSLYAKAGRRYAPLVMAGGTNWDDVFQSLREEYPPGLTTAQVAEILHIGPPTALSMASDGRLKASPIPTTRQ